MVHRMTLLAILVSALAMLPLATGAQDSSATCASAFWLVPIEADAVDAEDTSTVESAATAPAWMTAKMTDACSGATFALADFAGKTVYIEAMATWCPPCRDQLQRVKEAASSIPDEERNNTVFVALSSEVDLPRETLAQYAEDNGFPFVFAVMPAELLQAMVDDLGQEIAVPPATPHLVVAPDGTVGEVRTGSDSAEDLLALLAETWEASAS